MNEFLVKTRKEMENVVASILKEKYPNVEVISKPKGYFGLLLVKGVIKEDIEELPEVERVIPILGKCKAEIDEIVKTVEKVLENLEKFETFVVRTTRRGKNHNFTSIDCDRAVGARIKEITNADVDIEKPERVFMVEIINEDCYIGVLEGDEVKRKYAPGKSDVRKLLRKTVIVKLPYLESGAKEIGERIGRAAQSFEIKELITAPLGKVPAIDLSRFLHGLKIGVETRYEVQSRIYPRKVEKVELSVQSMYEVFRDKTERKKSLVIVTDPLGKQISDVEEELKRDLLRKDEIVIFIGSREGLPKGLFRKADYVLDLAPYITLATELVIPSVLTALISVWEKEDKFKNSEDKS